MLAFNDDAALMRILIACTVRYRSRGKWLCKIASAAAADQRRRADAQRKARSREQERAGVRSYRLWLSDNAILALIEAEQMTEQQALDHHAVERAMASLIEDLASECSRLRSRALARRHHPIAAARRDNTRQCEWRSSLSGRRPHALVRNNS
jgi:hypothetical protein